MLAINKLLENLIKFRLSLALWFFPFKSEVATFLFRLFKSKKLNLNFNTRLFTFLLILGANEINSQDGFYSQGFETTNDWTLSPTPVLNGNNYWVWGLGSPGATSGAATHTGTGSLQIWDRTDNVWYDDYWLYYNTFGYTRMATKTFNFSSIPCGSKLTMTYWVLCNGETGYDDLTVSVNNILFHGPMTRITTWQQRTIDLSSFVGSSNVIVSFNWRNDDDSYNYPGAKVDDISISYSPLLSNPNAGTDVTICKDSNTQLSGSANASTRILSENFDSTFPSNWTRTSRISSGDFKTSNDLLSSGSTWAGNGYNGYCIFFHSYSISSGQEGELISPSVNLSNYLSPNLTFWIYNSGGSDILKVYATSNNSNYTLIGNTNGYGVYTSWTQITISLSSFVGLNNVKIKLIGKSDYGYSNIGIDDFNISGTPIISYSWTPISGLSSSSIYNPIASPTTTTTYTMTATAGGCSVTDDVKVTVTPLNTTTSTTSSPTLCVNSALTNITHTTTGATGIGTISNLPSGVSAGYTSNQITISGTPTVSGTFPYSISLTGGCGNVNATGTIKVNPKPSTSLIYHE